MKFCDNLKKIRKDNNLSQEQFAQLLGVSRQSVSKWETGETYPEMDKMLKMCEMFNINIDELLNKDIREEKESKQSKNNINKIINEILNYITKTVDMFSSFKFGQKIKCLFEQVIIFLVLLIIFKIISGILGNFFSSIISIIPKDSIRNFIFNIAEGIFSIAYFILAAGIMLHIFKIRYLDYFQIIKLEDNHEEKINLQSGKNIKDNKQEIVLKKEKMVIRDPEHSSYKFINGILKIFLIFVKIFVAWISIFFCGILVILCCFLIMSFTITKTGSLFLGIVLILLGAIWINIVILNILYNFIVCRKSKFKLLGYYMLFSIILIGIGLGFSFLGIKEFDVLDLSDDRYYIKEERNVNMTDTLTIADYDNVSFSYEDRDDIKIEIIHSKYQDIEIDEYDSDNKTLLHFTLYDSYNNVMEVIRNQILIFNEKKIMNTNEYKIIIYGSYENIQKLKDNYEL